MFIEGQHSLGLLQRGFGELIGVSERTIQRWTASGHGGFTQDQLLIVARALYPLNRDLAAAYAERAGTTLVWLGLEAVPVVVSAPVGPPPVPTAMYPVIADGLLHGFAQHIQL